MKHFNTILSPSILAANHAALGEGLKTVLDCHLPWVHLDIMDGNFVPNISFGPQAVKDLRKQNISIFFDTHLMLARPDKYIENFAAAGSQLITIHVEPDGYDVAGTLADIRSKGLHAGISLNPDTPVERVLPYLDKVDLVLVMSVFPGFGGQSFMDSVLPKVEKLARLRDEGAGEFRIEMDGGIDLKTAPLCKNAGADTLVAGTAFFKAQDKAKFIEEITR
ncbi:MAG: ribulose-phosphate 3-epimerase [Opitutales bacterium]|nr:ribulose-phosphate 3-epimerase [Opitutales bacterium]